MPRKKAATAIIDQAPIIEEVLKPRRFAKLKSMRHNYHRAFTPLLVIALLGAVYYIGTLRGELKNGGSGGKAKLSAQGLPYAPADIPPVTRADHIRGNPNAKVVLVEYSDYECPYCKSFHPTMQQLMQTNGNDIAWVYRQFPIQQIHPNAPKESEAGECVAELGGDAAFWRFTDLIFERTASGGTGFALDQLPALAKEVGVDGARFKDCLDSGRMAQKVQSQMSEGTTGGIEGTPTTFILTQSKPSFFFFKKKNPVQMIPGVVDVTKLQKIVTSLG